MKKTIIITALMATFGSHAELTKPQDTYTKLVDSKGNVSFPAGFQTELVHVGTTAVIAPDSIKVQNLNGIYTQRVSIEHYNQTGEWLDGTVFVY